jgi:hypothetical protein
MNATACRLEDTLRQIGECWAIDKLKQYGPENLQTLARMRGYGPMIEASKPAMAAITTLTRTHPDLRRTDAVDFASLAAASLVNRSR